MPPPVWLPDLFPVNPWSIDTYERLYYLFKENFIASQPIYNGYAIWLFTEIEDGKQKIFWHLTSREDKETGERLPDLRRSERLPWVRPMVEQSERPEILNWDYEEGDGTVKTYVWLKDHDFVVIMKKYRDGRRRLITSFWVEYEHTRRTFKRKYERRLL